MPRRVDRQTDRQASGRDLTAETPCWAGRVDRATLPTQPQQSTRIDPICRYPSILRYREQADKLVDWLDVSRLSPAYARALPVLFPNYSTNDPFLNEPPPAAPLDGDSTRKRPAGSIATTVAAAATKEPSTKKVKTAETGDKRSSRYNFDRCNPGVQTPASDTRLSTEKSSNTQDSNPNKTYPEHPPLGI